MSDSIDKSWDHPWTTDEMRKKRREWSLAGDIGLLKHLQHFSEVCDLNFWPATLPLDTFCVIICFVIF